MQFRSHSSQNFKEKAGLLPAIALVKHQSVSCNTKNNQYLLTSFNQCATAVYWNYFSNGDLIDKLSTFLEFIPPT